LELDKLKGDYRSLTTILIEVETQITKYVEKINTAISDKKVIENDNLILRKDKDQLTRQLAALEPYKKLTGTVEQYKIELELKSKNLIETKDKMNKEINILKENNNLLEIKNKEINELNNKFNMELKHKD